jgi:hypothetical protein
VPDGNLSAQYLPDPTGVANTSWPTRSLRQEELLGPLQEQRSGMGLYDLNAGKPAALQTGDGFAKPKSISSS